MALCADSTAPIFLQFHYCLYCSYGLLLNGLNFPLAFYTAGLPVTLTVQELCAVSSKQLPKHGVQQVGALFQQLAEQVYDKPSENSTVAVAPLLWRVVRRPDLVASLEQHFQQGSHVHGVFNLPEMIQLLAAAPLLTSALIEAVKAVRGNWLLALGFCIDNLMRPSPLDRLTPLIRISSESAFMPAVPKFPRSIPMHAAQLFSPGPAFGLHLNLRPSAGIWGTSWHLLLADGPLNLTRPPLHLHNQLYALR